MEPLSLPRAPGSHCPGKKNVTHGLAPSKEQRPDICRCSLSRTGARREEDGVFRQAPGDRQEGSGRLVTRIRNNAMGMIRTDKLKPDMVLARDIRDVNGRLLLSKGETLGSRKIRILKMWGITEVSVMGDSPEGERDASGADPRQAEQTREQTRHVFKHVDLSHPAARELFRLSMRFRLRQPVCLPAAPPPGRKEDDGGDVLEDLRRKIATRKIVLPEIPSTAHELNRVIADRYASANSIARVVNKSPSLAALLLRIVNSAFYGFPSQIDTISRAVAIIGTREISDLALGISTLTMFRDIPPHLVDMPSFLKHSFACGIVSRILGAYRNMPQTEQLFVSGLLHDIGRLVVFKYYPHQAERLLHTCLESGTLLHRQERRCLGCTHTEVASFLLRRWRLPAAIADNVVHHHNPSGRGERLGAATVHLADFIVNGLGVGSAGERFVPPLDTDAWDALGLSPSCFEVVINQAEHQLTAIEPFMT